MNFENMKERSANELKSLLTKGEVVLFDIDTILSDLDDFIDDIIFFGEDKDILGNVCYYERNTDFRLIDSSENRLFKNKAFSCYEALSLTITLIEDCSFQSNLSTMKRLLRLQKTFTSATVELLHILKTF